MSEDERAEREFTSANVSSKVDSPKVKTGASLNRFCAVILYLFDRPIDFHSRLEFRVQSVSSDELL